MCQSPDSAVREADSPVMADEAVGSLVEIHVAGRGGKADS